MLKPHRLSFPLPIITHVAATLLSSQTTGFARHGGHRSSAVVPSTGFCLATNVLITLLLFSQYRSGLLLYFQSLSFPDI